MVKTGRGRPPVTWCTSMMKLLSDEELPDLTTQDKWSLHLKIRRADPTYNGKEKRRKRRVAPTVKVIAVQQ